MGDLSPDCFGDCTSDLIRTGSNGFSLKRDLWPLNIEDLIGIGWGEKPIKGQQSSGARPGLLRRKIKLGNPDKDLACNH